MYEVIVQRDVMATMRDGVRLAADVYLPARDGEPLPGRHPALLHRTQYDKTAVERGIGWCRWFAERGYVAILQDSRGTFESEGVTNFFIPEAEDGFDTLEWIGRQTWSDGQVGNWGISWGGLDTDRDGSPRAAEPGNARANFQRLQRLHEHHPPGRRVRASAHGSSVLGLGI